MGGMTDCLGVRIMCLYGSTYGLVIQLGRTMKTIQLPVYVWYKAVLFSLYAGILLCNARNWK
jgi:hypothetical protein